MHRQEGLFQRSAVSKYTRAKLNEDSIVSNSRSSSGVSSHNDTPATTLTRVGSTSTLASSGRPYSTSEESRLKRRQSVASTSSGASQRLQRGQKSIGNAKNNPDNGSRQSSADSGIDEENLRDTKYLLPPRITSYIESECYLMSLPRYDQFVNHIVRYLRSIMAELKFTQRDVKTQIHNFAPKLHRVTQELVIAFPRSASLISNSPRFQEFLRLAVENVVMRFVHDQIFPVICHLSEREDKDLLACATYLNQVNFSAEQLGLSEDYCVPLFAAVVELSSIDMRTTPLDRLTCIYDTVEQIKVHIREAIIEAHPDKKKMSSEDLVPSDHDMILLLATVLVQARPMHLMSTLNYADLFAWTVPIDMIEVVTLMSSAADFLRNVQPKKLLPSSGRLKREVSMEEIIQLTDEVQQSYDRHGNRREPLKSALDLHRERFAQRLEQSSADRAKRQEEAWARLDRCDTPVQDNMSRVKRGLLSTIHAKLLCSSNPVEVISSQ